MKWSKAISIGKSKQQAGDTKNAIKQFKKALVIAQNKGCKKEKANTLERLGNAYFSIESYREAVDYYEKGLEIAQEIGEKKLECEICHGIGVACSELGDYEQSLKYMKQGFVAALRIDDIRLLAMSYFHLGSTYVGLSDDTRSIKCFEKAIHLFKNLNDVRMLGKCYGNMGKSYHNQGNYHDAICIFEESLRISVALEDKNNEAFALLDLGLLYAKLNDIDKATNLYHKSLDIIKEITRKGCLALCYCNIACILSSLENYQEAVIYFEKCFKTAIEVGNEQMQAATISNFGACLEKLERFEEANELYNKGLALTKGLNNKGLESTLLFNMTEMKLKINDVESASTSLEECISIASVIGNKDLESKTWSLLGTIQYEYHYDTDDGITKAEKYFRKALSCFDILFQHLHQRDHFKVSIFERFTYTYKLFTTMLIETKQPQEALLVSDGGRARALGDRLVFKYNGMIQQECSLPQSLTYPDVESILSNDGFSILHYSILDNSLALWVLAKDTMVLKETDKNQFDTAMETLLEEEESTDENSMDNFFADTVRRAYEMMKMEDSSACENRSLDDCVRIKDHTCDISSMQSHGDGTSEESLTQQSNPLEMLYNCLVAPVLSDVRHNEIVIVPDGPIYKVPLAALRDPNTGLYLCDKKHIRLAPSLAVLKALNECPADHHSQKGALIVGDPSVGEVMFRGKKKTFARLSSANWEVSIISGMLRQRALTGEQATKNAVLEKLKDGSALIHIAAHGSSDNGEIALAPNVSPERQGIPEENDYLLTIKEVQEIGIKAQLVVLSCCNSGCGKIRAEGMVGLSRAFLVAGARAVVASLWAIDDIVTLTFMLSFYRYMTRGERASMSLHKAMHEIKKEYRDPKYWAPFFLIGDDVILPEALYE